MHLPFRQVLSTECYLDDDADEENVDDEDYVDFPREAVKRAAEP